MYDAMKRAIEQAEEAAQSLIDKQAALLSGVAVALRGPEPPQTRWSHHDLPERAEAAVSELATANATLAQISAGAEAMQRELAEANDEIARLRTLKDAEPGQWNAALELADLRARLEAKPRLPTIEEMSGLVEDFTEGMSLKEYMEKLSNE